MRTNKKTRKTLLKRITAIVVVALILALNSVFMYMPDPKPDPVVESVLEPIVERGECSVYVQKTIPQITLEQEKLAKRAQANQESKISLASRSIEKREIPLHFEMSLLTPSGLTAQDLEKRLSKTTLKGLSEYYIRAEYESGVNALFLVSLSAHESSWGKSKIAGTKNNLFGWGANTEDPSNAKSFSTKGECILHVANKIKSNYLTESGKYFRGYTLSDMNKIYAADKEWDSKIFKTMKSILKEVR